MTAKARRASLTFGNLTMNERPDGTVELTLNTFIKGRPYALFTKGEIPKLIEILGKYGTSPDVKNEDWQSLI